MPGLLSSAVRPRVYSVAMKDHRIELVLIRHGETASSRDGFLAGSTDVPLTEKGETQAAALRPHLAGRDFDSVRCSDLHRARRTAELAWGAATPDPRLREVNFGSLEGEQWNTLPEVHKQSLIALDGFSFPGGENFAQVRDRLGAVLGELGPGRHLLFVHGGVIRILTREAGLDAFVPTGTMVIVDWTARTVLARFHPEGLDTFTWVRREDAAGATAEPPVGPRE